MADRSFTIHGTTITDDGPCYVVAELSHNHQGSLDIALEMIRVAKECGADAVKLQKRSPGFYAALRAKGLTEYADVREGRELDVCDYQQLREYAHNLGLAFIVTAFDVEAIDFLRTVVNVDSIKLASGAVHNPALLRAADATGLPLLLSTGCADRQDVFNAMMRLPGNVALLQCTSSYPCAAADLHLRTLTAYRADYPQTVVGLSSHRLDNTLEPVAYALGARIIEKHFTLSTALGVGDHANSLDPAGLADLVAKLRETEAAMGDGVKRFLQCEEAGRMRLDMTYCGPSSTALNVYKNEKGA
jgi:sialic acid synthase